MRKAVQAAARRNQRRRETPAVPAEAPPVATKESMPTVNVAAATQPTDAAANKRKATPDEAALTAKNYRLAKELSELRVRHREECKNVTRLTMENMNLASRCREALSHVAMLKRELAAHQRRSAEALAMQRQNSEARALAVASPTTTATPSSTPASTPAASVEQAMSTPKTSRTLEVVTNTPTAGHNTPSMPLTSPGATESPLATPPKLTPRRAVDVARELEILDETVASHALKAQAAATTPKSPVIEAPEEPESPNPLSDPVDSDDFEEESLSTTNQLHPPQSVDDVPGHRPVHPEEESLDDSDVNTSSGTTPIGMASPPKTYFPHSASPKVDNYDEEYPSDFSAVRKRAAMRPKLGMLTGFAENEDEGSSYPLGKKSSLDAFEASFATDFPDSFSPRDTVAEEKKSEIYNPFNSPAKPKPAGTARVEPPVYRKDPPGRVRTSQRTAQNKVFMALSQSPRGLDENRSPRLSSVSPRQTATQEANNGFRKNGFTRALNPPPLDVKQAETGRSRYDRLTQQQQQRKVVPFDEPRNDDPVTTDGHSSPRQEKEEEPTTPVSVKDRASLFTGGGPRSPEKESMRLSSLNSRYSYERTFVDEGDIPMISNLGRPKTSPPRQEPVPSTTSTGATNNYGMNSSRSPHYPGPGYSRRVQPWDDSQKDDMEHRRGTRQPVSYS